MTPKSTKVDTKPHGVWHTSATVYFLPNALWSFCKTEWVPDSRWGAYGMNRADQHHLWLESNSLAAQADTLLTGTYHQIDPEMAAFLSTYVVGLQSDFYDALQATSCEREVLLQLIISEMRDLVHDIQCRITQAEAISVHQTLA